MIEEHEEKINSYSYLITDPLYCGYDLAYFSTILEKSLNKHKNISLACLRVKTGINIENLAIIFYKICKKHKIKKIILHSYYRLAKQLNFDGIHLSSNSYFLASQTINDNLWTIISTHNENEVQQAIKLKANAITYSPIFRNKFSNQKAFDSLIRLNKKYTNIPIYALGGVSSDKQIEILKENNINNFASISYFF